MKHSIQEIPKEKQAELDRVVGLVRKYLKPEIVILFGSYARGGWVEDSYLEDYIVYEYQSDFDILVVVSDKQEEESLGKPIRMIESRIEKHHEIKTPVNIIVENIDFLNTRVREKHYFYVDISKEGIILYDSKRAALKQKTRLPEKEKLKIIIENFEYWLEIYDELIRSWEGDMTANMGGVRRKIAAFHLHQATEALYVAFLIVHIYYKPKTHDLKKLANKANPIYPKLADIFPGKTEKDKMLFQLLRKAYVDARYKRSYSISKVQLEDIKERIEIFHRDIVDLCRTFLSKQEKILEN